MNNKKSQDDNLTRLFDAVVNSIGILSQLTWHGSVRLGRMIYNQPLWLVYFIGSFFVIKHFALQGYHLSFWHWIWPALFSGKLLNWLYSIPAKYHYWCLYLGSHWLWCIVLGAAVLIERRKIKQGFEAIGLKNGLSELPTLLARKKVDDYREKITLDAKGIGLDRFQAKKQSLEAIFKTPIEGIQRGKDLGLVEITLSTRTLESFVPYCRLQSEKPLKRNHFYVGESMKGIKAANLCRLPHMLIAGATGGGKSVFFKQTLTGLLSSSDHLQMYLIDLKKGLEFVDFRQAPNVRVVKSIEDTVRVLGAVKKEMDQRFKFLESKNLKSIDPKRDKKDRIVVAVDEAGELYANPSKYDDDFELVQKAQSLTNSIARLGRAAGIHLILATQKVSKETINTCIQENISARMCFKMNTLHGSLQVLGRRDALDLPTTPGRGIWQYGTEQSIVQVPYVDEEKIGEVCQNVDQQFSQGSKWLQQEMLIDGNGGQENGEESDFRKNLIDANA